MPSGPDRDLARGPRASGLCDAPSLIFIDTRGATEAANLWEQPSCLHSSATMISLLFGGKSNAFVHVGLIGEILYQKRRKLIGC